MSLSACGRFQLSMCILQVPVKFKFPTILYIIILSDMSSSVTICHIQRSTFRRLQPSIIYTTTQTFSKMLTSLAYIPRVKHLTFQGSKDVVQTGYESMLIRGSNLTEVRRYSKVGPVRTIFMPRSLESRYIRLEVLME